MDYTIVRSTYDGVDFRIVVDIQGLDEPGVLDPLERMYLMRIDLESFTGRELYKAQAHFVCSDESMFVVKRSEVDKEGLSLLNHQFRRSKVYDLDVTGQALRKEPKSERLGLMRHLMHEVAPRVKNVLLARQKSSNAAKEAESKETGDETEFDSITSDNCTSGTIKPVKKLKRQPRKVAKNPVLDVLKSIEQKLDALLSKMQGQS